MFNLQISRGMLCIMSHISPELSWASDSCFVFISYFHCSSSNRGRGRKTPRTKQTSFWLTGPYARWPWNLGRVKYEHQHALAWGSHDSLALALFSKQIFLILSLYQYSEIKLGAIGPNYNYFQLKGYLSHCEATSLSKHCLPLPRTFTQQLVLLSLLV